MRRPRTEDGTAIVELVWLAILLLVPLVYIVVAVFETQRTAYAASTAARSATRAFVTSPDEAGARPRALAAARLAFADQGIEGAPLDVVFRCRPDPRNCLAPGEVVSAEVHSSVALPARPRCARQRCAPDQRVGAAPVAVRHLPRGPAVKIRDERGSVTPLIIGFALILATLVAVVVDASAAYLRRSGMNSLADAAALSATDGLQGDQVYSQGLGKRARIDPVAAHRYVEDYLAGSGARAAYPGLVVQVVTDDNVVRVHLSSPLRLPLRVPGVVGESSVSGDAAAEVLVTD